MDTKLGQPARRTTPLSSDGRIADCRIQHLPRWLQLVALETIVKVVNYHGEERVRMVCFPDPRYTRTTTHWELILTMATLVKASIQETRSN
jgi:hypothetical protein